MDRSLRDALHDSLELFLKKHVHACKQSSFENRSVNKYSGFCTPLSPLPLLGTINWLIQFHYPETNKLPVFWG